MKKIIYKIWAYVGYYNLVIDFNDKEVNYAINALNYSDTKNGTLEEKEVKEFNKLIKKAHLEYIQEACYEDEELICDTPQTNLCYVDDKTNVYFVINIDEETKEYEYLMKAIGVIDSKFIQFMRFD